MGLLLMAFITYAGIMACVFMVSNAYATMGGFGLILIFAMIAFSVWLVTRKK